jgi:hypothetical protein
MYDDYSHSEAMIVAINTAVYCRTCDKYCKSSAGLAINTVRAVQDLRLIL